MNKLICEATPNGVVYCDKEVKNVNFMAINNNARVSPMMGGVAVSTLSTFSYNREGYFHNVRI